MAQQNHNIDYINTVDGLTVWERLRVIRNFLQDREIALQIAKLGPDPELSPRELQEYEIMAPQLEQNIKNAEDEIKFLKEFESVLKSEAELTRIPGKTDDEMYEINYAEEIIQRQLLDIQSQIMSNGHIDSNTMKTLIRNPRTLERGIQLNLLPSELQTQAKFITKNMQLMKVIAPYENNIIEYKG
ncbi:MAG: hypothetical protein WC136_06575 [Sphaerochaeta sp.]|jgi:hypothetical protein